jgi:hypothetical protein
MTRYSLKASIQAIYRTLEGGEVRVTLPSGATLVESVQRSRILGRMIGVYWEGRCYSVFPRDLLKKAERVSTA